MRAHNNTVNYIYENNYKNNYSYVYMVHNYTYVYDKYRLDYNQLLYYKFKKESEHSHRVIGYGIIPIVS